MTEPKQVRIAYGSIRQITVQQGMRGSILTITGGALLFAFVIFIMRVLNYAIGTMRMVFITRDMRLPSAVMAFVEALIFAVVMAQVLKDITDMINLIAYCLGAAVGSYLGQWIESKIIVSYSTVTIIAAEHGIELAEKIRAANYGATVSKGEGRDGEVTIIRSTIVNKNIPHFITTVHDINPDAFIDVEAARRLYRGWIPGSPPGRS